MSPKVLIVADTFRTGYSTTPLDIGHELFTIFRIKLQLSRAKEIKHRLQHVEQLLGRISKHQNVINSHYGILVQQFLQNFFNRSLKM